MTAPLVPPGHLPLSKHKPRTREQVIFQRLVRTLETPAFVTPHGSPPTATTRTRTALNPAPISTVNHSPS